MSILFARAKIQCDGCARPFIVDLDPAERHIEDLADYIEDVVRGGNAFREFCGTKRAGTEDDTGITSVQDDKMLCPNCTREADYEDQSLYPTASPPRA